MMKPVVAPIATVADLRRPDAAAYKKWYRKEHTAPEFLASFVYVLCEVNRSQIRGAQATILRLSVAPEDKGWVIGRHGRVANAMRTLLRVAASNQGGRRAILEID